MVVMMMMMMVVMVMVMVMIRTMLLGPRPGGVAKQRLGAGPNARALAERFTTIEVACFAHDLAEPAGESNVAATAPGQWCMAVVTRSHNGRDQ